MCECWGQQDSEVPESEVPESEVQESEVPDSEVPGRPAAEFHTLAQCVALQPVYLILLVELLP
jgi:hypothetical protein